jgi:YhcH/YjgK/YiaL family protein
MIVDRLENASLYSNLAPRVTTALAYLRDKDFASMEPGRYDIQGDEIYAMVQEYTTKDANEVKWEAHRQYIDVQYVARGNERMGYANLGELTVIQDYQEKDDYLLLEGEGDFLAMVPGTFIVLGPQDAHMPQVAASTPSAVRKVVIKVAV